MAGFVVQENGFVKAGDLIRAVVANMEANGFVRMFPAAPINDPAPNSFVVTLEAGPTVDQLSATQPWRIHLGDVAQWLEVYLGERPSQTICARVIRSHRLQ